LYVDVNGDVAEKRDELSAALGPAKVTDVESYCRQTFAQTISQLGLFTAVAWVAASLTAMLIAALFLKMLVSKDLSEIAILRSLGFSPEDIRGQYLTRILSVLVVGIAAGTAAANTLGEALVACALSLFGAPGFRFYIDPLRSYALLPLSMVALVSAAAFAATGAIGRFRVSDLTIE
jgi:putative ABC transport system permease protein